jgi:predicted enzyme related to lactoylglutathione lyase
MPKVIHFELSADNPERAMKFYEKVFDWKFKQYGDQKYWLILTGGDDEKGGIHGAIQPREEGRAPVVNTINVKDIDDAIKKIKANGGKVITDKMVIPEVGTMVYFQDTEGNVHGAMQSVPNPRMIQ